jgi:hypothetical protein
VAGRAGRSWAAGRAQGLGESPASLSPVGGVGRRGASPPCDRAVSRGGQRGMGVGSVAGPLGARLSPACRHRDAGLALAALAGVAATPEPRKPGAPTRPFFPLGPVAGVVRCQRCIGRERGGYATKRCSGGCPRNGSWLSAHSGSNKVVLENHVDVLRLHAISLHHLRRAQHPNAYSPGSTGALKLSEIPAGQGRCTRNQKKEGRERDFCEKAPGTFVP